MLNRTNRTLSASSDRLNLGTRSLAVTVSNLNVVSTLRRLRPSSRLYAHGFPARWRDGGHRYQAAHDYGLSMSLVRPEFARRRCRWFSTPVGGGRRGTAPGRAGGHSDRPRLADRAFRWSAATAIADQGRYHCVRETRRGRRPCDPILADRTLCGRGMNSDPLTQLRGSTRFGPDQV